MEKQEENEPIIDHQKQSDILKVLKRVIIQPSKMIIMHSVKEQELIRKSLVEMFGIPSGDITFTFTEKKNFICPICKKSKYDNMQNRLQIYKKCKCGYVFDYVQKY